MPLRNARMERYWLRFRMKDVNPKNPFEIYYDFEKDSTCCVSKNSFGIKIFQYSSTKTALRTLPVKFFHCLTTISNVFSGVKSLIESDINLLAILGFFILIILIHPGCLPNGAEEHIRNLKSSNPVVLSDAIYQLGEMEEKVVVPSLLSLLNGQPKEIRLRTIDALGKIGDNRATEALCGILNETDRDIVLEVIEALGKIRDKRATPLLTNFLDDDEFRFYAIWALGNIGDKRSIPSLVRFLERDDKYLTYITTQALKKIGN